MNFYIWPANLSEKCGVLGPLESSGDRKFTAVTFDQNDHATNENSGVQTCLYLDDGCAYEAVFSKNLENGDIKHSLEEETADGGGDGTGPALQLELSPTALVYTPLAKFRVVSLHCGYGVFGAITSSCHAYIWGNSEKGQCGIVSPNVVKPQRVALKTAEILCEHGSREFGRELPFGSLAFGKTLCMAICSDGSLWSWGAISADEAPQVEPSRVVALYGRRVLSVACGEAHYLALVACEKEGGRVANTASSSPEFGLLNFVDSCVKCRELRTKKERATENRDVEDGCYWESKTNASLEVNFDDSTIFCPLGLRLELSLGSSPPADYIDDSGVNFTFDDSASIGVPKNNASKKLASCSMSVMGDVGSRSLSRQRCRERGDIELTEMRKAKSVGTRFSFTSFEFNAVEISSSSGNSGGELGSDEPKTECSGVERSLSSLSTDTLFRSKFGRQKCSEQSSRTMAVPVSTEVWSWGHNSCGQLGLGDLLDRSEPCRLDKLKGACIMRVEAGAFHSLALSSIGEVWTWGSNLHGQIKQANINVQPIPTVMKVGSQSSVLDCAAGPDFTVLLVNGLDFRTDLYYCGRDHRVCNQDSQCDTNAGVAVRLSSVTKHRWPVGLKCTHGSIIALTRDARLSAALQRLLELACSEIKFAYKLKKLHGFALELCQQYSTDHTEDGQLVRAYADELARFFAIVVQCGTTMKSELCEMLDPMIPSKFVNVLLSTSYGSTLKRLHSVYCQMMASNVFTNINFTDSLEKSLMDLSVANEIESSKPYRLLRKLYYIPFARLDEYSKLAQAIILGHKELEPNEHDRLVQFIKNVKISEQLLLNHYHLAENTGHFWSRCTGKNNLVSLKVANRFLIKEFTKTNGIVNILENGTSTNWQQALVFSDSVAFIFKHNNRVLELPLAWVVPLDSDSKYSVQLVAPEAVWTFELVDGVTKNDFVQCCSQALTQYQAGHYTEWVPGSTPPLRRVAHYKFSAKHNLYGDAFFNGSWALGKPHGRGEMTWSNGRIFRGKFKNGLMHGLGELRVTELNGGQTITKGHWKDGNLTGLSVIDYANGSKYEGYLKNGFRSGHGVLKQRNCLYVGAWNNDTRHGYGVLDKGKEKYLGMWEMDVENGLGTLVTLEGDYCEGTFDRGVFLKGKMTVSDGTRYEGEFNGIGMMSGKGSIHFLNGDTINGILHGSVMDQVKITSGNYKKSFEAVSTPICNTWLDCSAALDEQPALPAEQKWTDIFGHVYENLGIGQHGQPINGGRLWENVVATLERLKAFFNERSNAGLIEKVPTWDCPLNYSYLSMVFEYCSKAFAVPYHPFGRLLCGLTDVFNACYSGVGAHPKLLPHAVSEVFSVVRRLYQVVRFLFPSLPPECQLDNLIAERSDDSNKMSSYETYGSLFYDTFLQLIYPNLFTLYVLRNESLDQVYWEKIANLNLKNDVALLDYLGVCNALWPIELKNTDVLDAPLICATARKKYYADAIYCLQRLSSEFYPSAKLRVIVETFDNISKCVSRLASEPENQHTWTADSLVPVTTYVIVRAQIQRLGAEIQLTENFCPQLNSLGEVQYMFTMLQGCYQHIIQSKHFA